ncbi:hypothetical protein NHP22001_07820 [Helicobacter sp. NHP22-001]|nr:hypothetical protein NHP22001_07820 [Helicobacter sp. NHP22-001]
MKEIVFNASVIKGDLTGLGVYALIFIETLEKHFEGKKDINITIYGDGKFYPNLRAWLSERDSSNTRLKKKFIHLIKLSLIKPSKVILNQKLYLSLKYCFLNFLKKQRAKRNRKRFFDLYIEPSYEGVSFNAQKTLGCIHDLPLCDEKAWLISQEMKIFWREAVLPIMRTYTEAICFSECVRADILKTFGFPKEKVHVIYHGSREYREQHLEPLPPHLGEFILVVGAKAKRRNVRGLIDAFRLLSQELQSRFKIVLTGAPNDIDEYDKQYFSQDFIINLNYVSDGLLQTLYANARLLWWGSFAEGFGLPMVEAMRASCVVLASDVSCMPEILGDAGVYCNPYSVADIARQLEIALTDEFLRQECIKKGLERAKLFDFKESMQKHVEIVERMLGD